MLETSHNSVPSANVAGNAGSTATAYASITNCQQEIVKSTGLALHDRLLR
jgi:hypothetical protein